MKVELHGRIPLEIGSIVNSNHHKYQIGEPIGAGAFSIVYAAKSLKTGDVVAIKEFYSREFSRRNSKNQIVAKSGEFDSSNTSSEGRLTSTKKVKDSDIQNVVGHMWALEKAKREEEVLSKLSHPNVVQLKNSFEENRTTYLVMEKHNTSPKKPFYRDDTYTIEEKFKKILHGIAALHYQKYVHRDIKPANILWDEEDNPVITDLGMVADVDEELDEFAVEGSVYSPEILDGSYQLNTDLYSAAAVAYSWLKGAPPLPESRQSDLLLENNSQLNYVINTAMDIDESKRFSFVTDLFNALGHQTLVTRIERPNVSPDKVRHAKGLIAQDASIKDETINFVDTNESFDDATRIGRRKDRTGSGDKNKDYSPDLTSESEIEKRKDKPLNTNKALLAIVASILLVIGIVLFGYWWSYTAPVDNSDKKILIGNIDKPIENDDETEEDDEADKDKLKGDKKRLGDKSKPESQPPSPPIEEPPIVNEPVRKLSPYQLPFAYEQDTKLEPDLLTKPLLVSQLRMYLTKKQMIGWEYGLTGAECNESQNVNAPLVTCISPILVKEFLDNLAKEYQGQGFNFRLISPYQLTVVYYPLPESFPKLLTCAYEYGNEKYCDHGFSQKMQVFEVIDGETVMTHVDPDKFSHFQVRLLISKDD